MVAARSERIALSLPDSKIVSAVLAEMEGTLRAGRIVVDTSTGEPDDARCFAAALGREGVAYLDATISGSSEQLRRGEALCMAGGDGAHLRAAAIFWPRLAPTRCTSVGVAMARG